MGAARPDCSRSSAPPPAARQSQAGVIETWKRVLALAPHTDDGEFGCGGTMARLVEAGLECTTTPSRSRPARCRPASRPTRSGALRCAKRPASWGSPRQQLRVHDFDVRTFPEHRQDILEFLVGSLWEELSGRGLPAVAPRRAPGPPDDRAGRPPAAFEAHDRARSPSGRTPDFWTALMSRSSSGTWRGRWRRRRSTP